MTDRVNPENRKWNDRVNPENRKWNDRQETDGQTEAKLIVLFGKASRRLKNLTTPLLTLLMYFNISYKTPYSTKLEVHGEILLTWRRGI
jgi:hypothetical protein